MINPNMIILYVNDPTASASFYSTLLKQKPVETSPNFAMFVLESGLMLGLWAKHAVEPVTTMTGGGTELGFPMDSNAAVDILHAEWCAQKIVIAQAPVQMDFAYTFVGLDLDGHRLRVFGPTPISNPQI